MSKTKRLLLRATATASLGLVATAIPGHAAMIPNPCIGCDYSGDCDAYNCPGYGGTGRICGPWVECYQDDSCLSGVAYYCDFS